MNNEEIPFDVSTCDNPVVRDGFRYFCRHLVCLGGTPQRVAKALRDLPDRFSFRSAVKAKSLPIIVIAKNADLGEVEADKLKGRVEEGEAGSRHRRTAWGLIN